MPPANQPSGLGGSKSGAIVGHWKNVEFATAVRAERAEPPSFERLDTGARRAINDCLVRQWTPGTPGRASN